MSEQSSARTHYLTSLYQSPYIKAMNLIQESFASGNKLRTWELLESFYHGLPPDASRQLKNLYSKIKSKLCFAERSNQSSDRLIEQSNQYEAVCRVLRTGNLEFYQKMIQVLFELKYLEKGAIIGENPDPDHIGLDQFGKDQAV